MGEIGEVFEAFLGRGTLDLLHCLDSAWWRLATSE